MIFAERSHDPLSPRVLIFVEKRFGTEQCSGERERTARGKGKFHHTNHQPHSFYAKYTLYRIGELNQMHTYQKTP
ncbi:hypothetical protein O988_08372 [Pseudogymnoascus sp. VKM F-3808]|nr:hypothetical protein O988_08372 [Pseudogymnoascus sp. VKM F-3808]